MLGRRFLGEYICGRDNIVHPFVSRGEFFLAAPYHNSQIPTMEVHTAAQPKTAILCATIYPVDAGSNPRECWCPAGSDGSYSQLDVIQWEKIAIRIRELFIQGRKTRQSGQKPFASFGLDSQAIIPTSHDGLLRVHLELTGNTHRLIATIAKKTYMTFRMHGNPLSRHGFQHRSHPLDPSMNAFVCPIRLALPPIPDASCRWG